MVTSMNSKSLHRISTSTRFILISTLSVFLLFLLNSKFKTFDDFLTLIPALVAIGSFLITKKDGSILTE